MTLGSSSLNGVKYKNRFDFAIKKTNSWFSKMRVDARETDIGWGDVSYAADLGFAALCYPAVALIEYVSSFWTLDRIGNGQYKERQ